MENRITSVERTISKKKEVLGLNASILDLKGLKKYGELADITYPKMTRKNFTVVRDVQNRLDEKPFREDLFQTYCLTCAYKKMVNVVGRHVQEQVEAFMCPDRLSASLFQETFSSIHLPYEIEPAFDEADVAIARLVFERRQHVNATHVYRISFSGSSHTLGYTTCDALLTDKATGVFHTSRSHHTVTTLSFTNAIAQRLILSAVAEYCAAQCEPSSDANLTQFVSNWDTLLNDNSDRLPTAILVLVVPIFSEMIRKVHDLAQLQTKFQSSSANYAKTFEMKKNIPQKLQTFMANNQFLSIFGEVETDERCDLEKMKALADEFNTLQLTIQLPAAKSYALRFRRLGKIKASGVLYPDHTTLALDPSHGIASFFHELFHLIDFEHGLKSFDASFESLYQAYASRVQSANSTASCPLSKKELAYYLDKHEVFARLGELYTYYTLGLNTSFNKIDFESEERRTIYPHDESFLADIQRYFERELAGILVHR